MDIKLLSSKINHLEAQLNQFKNSPLFTKEEAVKLCEPYETMLISLKHYREGLTNKTLSEIEKDNLEVLKK